MKIKNSEKNKGIIALIILSVVFASMGVFVRFLQTDFTILQQTYLRVFAAFILGLIIFYKDLNFKKIKLISIREWMILMLRSISLYVVGVTLLSQAYITTKYSNVSFIGSLPIVGLFGFILLKEKVSLSKILYILLGFVGVVLISIQGYSHFFSWGTGELLALVASFAFAISYIARKWQDNLLNNKEIAVIIFFIAGILLFTTSLILGEGLLTKSSFSEFIIPVIIIAGLFNVANLFLTNYGFQKVGAVLAGNLLMLEMVFAVVLGFIFYMEVPTIKELLGGLLIILSVYKINKLSN